MATTTAFIWHEAKEWVKYCTPVAQLVTVRGTDEGDAEIEQGILRLTRLLIVSILNFSIMTLKMMTNAERKA